MTDGDRIYPCLWFDGRAEEAAAFYVDLIPGSRIAAVQRMPGGPPDSPALTVAFELAGKKHLALNGNPGIPFTEAASLVVTCADQTELDRIWDGLGEGGTPLKCGWIKDRYGLSWQVVPAVLPQLMSGDADRAGRVMAALMDMVRIDIAALERAAS